MDFSVIGKALAADGNQVARVSVDPIVWLGLVALLGLLIAALAYFVKRERDDISKRMDNARVESHDNHVELSVKVDRIEREVGEVREKMGRFVTREEAERSHDRFLSEQKAERAELRGFLSAWLERIERTLERKQDRP